MLKTRYKESAWDLGQLFSSFEAPEIAHTLERVEQQLVAFEAYRGQLGDGITAEKFGEILNAYERLTQDLVRLLGFSQLSFAANTQDQQAQTYLAQFRQLVAQAQNRTLFFTLWWKKLDDEPAESLMAVAGDYAYWLEAVRLERPYTLSEVEEQVINLKDVNGPKALMTIFSTLTDRYTFYLEVDGEELELTRDEIGVYYRHPDPNVRKAAYQELFRVYENDKPILGQIYQYRVRDWRSEHVDLRGFDSPIAVRNLANDIPNEVVDILLDVSRANAPLFQRYFRLKAKWLGMERLRRYDIYAPVVKTEKRVDFADAVDLVLSSFNRFEPQVAQLAERVFAEGHIDSEVRKGKQGGAFCATLTPDLTPWILQSYHGRPADIATLAHELGHAVHALLAASHNTLTQHASLPLAETASTFGEMLVVDRLLAEDPDPETQRDLLFRQMDNNYATIMRQAYFAIFERDAHEKIAAGAMIDDITALYGQNLAEQFGNDLELSEEFSLEWLLVPHIYQSPFYVYAYAFGQLLVLSLYQQYLEEGDAFKPRYLKLLAAGGSDSPARILNQAGIEFHSTDFWQGGYDVLQASLEQLEALEIPAD